MEHKRNIKIHASYGNNKFINRCNFIHYILVYFRIQWNRKTSIFPNSMVCNMFNNRINDNLQCKNKQKAICRIKCFKKINVTYTVFRNINGYNANYIAWCEII